MENKKILVVDDERDMRIFVSTVVETLGFEPMVAKDGVEALEKARLNPPALVILDVMMPKIDDGIQAYRQFRTDPKLSHIPIIMLSAIPHAYMEKPPDAGELGKLIMSLL
jgi:CheY-like chemotaxis protein